MRQILTLCLLGLTLAGCQAAEAVSPVSIPNTHPFSSTEMIDKVLLKSWANSESIDTRLSYINAKLSDMRNEAATTNDLLGQLLEQQKLVAGQQCDLLNAAKLKETPVPPEPPKAVLSRSNSPFIDESLLVNPSDKQITTKDGKHWNYANFIKSYYRQPAFVEGMTVDQHLTRDHGVKYDPTMSEDEKNRLHAALHGYESGAKPVATPAPPPSNCPDGSCAIRSRTVTVTTPDSSRSSSTTIYSTPPTSSGWSVQSQPSYLRYQQRSRCNSRRCR